MPSVNNTEPSMMANLQQWFSDHLSPNKSQQGFAEQLAAAQNNTENTVRGGLSADRADGSLQKIAQSATNHSELGDVPGLRSAVLGGQNEEQMRANFTAIGSSIGLGLLAAFSGNGQEGSGFGVNGTGSGSKNTGTDLAGLTSNNMQFGVTPKAGKAQAAAAANNAQPAAPADAAATAENGDDAAAPTDTAQADNQNAAQADNAPAAPADATNNGDAETAAAPAESGNAFSRFFENLFGNGDQAPAAQTADNAAADDAQNDTNA